jgi:peptidoglycan/LPS O-acetylase OafA/YrhL
VTLDFRFQAKTAVYFAANSDNLLGARMNDTEQPGRNFDRSERIPTLDGWRGVAILIVLLSHFVGITKPGAAFIWAGAAGQHGVTIFLVLSGFLITSTLAGERPTLKQFYVKRILRLLPAAWVYLCFLALAGALLRLSLISSREALSCMLIYRNFQGPTGAGMTAHFWSLSLEEQFYLVWPPLLFALGNRRAMWLAGAGAAAISLYRFTHWEFYDRMYFCFRTEVRDDALLIGCLLALLWVEPGIRPRLERFAMYAWVPAAATTIYCVRHYVGLPPTIECLAIGILIIASLAAPRSLLTAPLHHRTLNWVGRISYSLYIWNFFFFLFHGAAMQSFTMFALMCCFAIGSYYIVERPSTLLGRRLAICLPALSPQQSAPLVPANG